MRWDVFCRVIDNHGDLGVCWRLCADLAQRGQRVRLWVDDASALAWMAPQGCTGVNVHAWPASKSDYTDCADVVIEAFGCELPEHVQSTIASQQPTPVVWINLEYLSAEDFVERCHGLPSPVMSGPAKGCTKWFFYPGFTPATGGLLREPDLQKRQAAFIPDEWLNQLNLPLRMHAQRMSLFCYEPAVLSTWLKQLAKQPLPVDILVARGRPQAAVKTALDHLGWANTASTWQQGISSAQGQLVLHPLPYLSQTDFDHLLWSCDLNMVRGEDSLVRALWAGKPFVWHIYPQDDNAHHVKLEAFLNSLQAPTSLREFHLAWNGISTSFTTPDSEVLKTWLTATQAMRQRLQWQVDLTTQLLLHTFKTTFKN
ncbi:hypothetical protein LMORI2_14860 [Limnohabitans sp. MORI2]|nr:hypothetical protein LMORI2_14860 [Limnohabitans sp. MORI2]